jgi:hypothetical protein
MVIQGREYWRKDYRPLPIADDDACVLAQEDCIRDNIAFWKMDAQLVALSGPCPVLEDGRGVVDSESSSEEHGEELTGM